MSSTLSQFWCSCLQNTVLYFKCQLQGRFSRTAQQLMIHWDSHNPLPWSSSQNLRSPWLRFTGLLRKEDTKEQPDWDTGQKWMSAADRGAECGQTQALEAHLGENSITGYGWSHHWPLVINLMFRIPSSLPCSLELEPWGVGLKVWLSWWSLWLAPILMFPGGSLPPAISPTNKKTLLSRINPKDFRVCTSENGGGDQIRIWKCHSGLTLSYHSYLIMTSLAFL